MRLLFLIITSMLSLIITPPTQRTLAQDAPEPPQQLVYLLHNNQLIALDIFTGIQQSTTSLPPIPSSNDDPSAEIDRRFWSAEIDPAGQIIYQIEAWGRSTNRRILNAPTGADLLQINLETNTREVIFDRTTVFNVVLSPDGERMIVFYYADEYLYSTQHACVLDLQTRDCLELNFDYVGRDGFWLDDNNFIIGTDDTNPLQLVDANDGSSRTIVIPLEWYVYWATPIPETNSLFLWSRPREFSGETPPISFMTYDLETETVNLLAYTAPNTRAYLSVNEMKLSPDGAYLLYRGSNTALVDFNSGEFIQEFTGVRAMDWIDNRTLLVQRIGNDGTAEILRIDPLSREITTLVNGESASSVMLVP